MLDSRYLLLADWIYWLILSIFFLVFGTKVTEILMLVNEKNTRYNGHNEISQGSLLQVPTQTEIIMLNLI